MAAHDHSRGQMTGLLSPFLERRRTESAAAWIPDGSRVLDLGCGRAPLLAALLSLGRRDIAYVGVDALAECVRGNEARYPGHRFVAGDFEAGDLEAVGGDFTVIALLAVLEHMRDPGAVVRRLVARLAPGGRVVLTTPAPFSRSIHAAGARLGVFSREACEEHERGGFLDRPALVGIAESAGLRLVCFRRFLLGVNQLAVLER